MSTWSPHDWVEFSALSPTAVHQTQGPTSLDCAAEGAELTKLCCIVNWRTVALESIPGCRRLLAKQDNFVVRGGAEAPLSSLRAVEGLRGDGASSSLGGSPYTLPAF